MDCCEPSGYRHLFNTKEADSKLKRYLKKGTNAVATRLIDSLVSDGIDEQTVIDVGCGIGVLYVELIEQGAKSATGVEISDGYATTASQLHELRGVTDKVTRLTLDFAEAGDAVRPADIVVLDRVVCCYLDWKKLLTSVSEHATGRVAFSFPRENFLSRLSLNLFNLWLRIRKVDFQAFVQPIDQMLALMESKGFTQTFTTNSLQWQGVIFERQIS
jgi:2-polyprenyl-3-methyl-5-hydroxy-6-metoxy-1,4-benzoquinol methylase